MGEASAKFSVSIADYIDGGSPFYSLLGGNITGSIRQAIKNAKKLPDIQQRVGVSGRCIG